MLDNNDIKDNEKVLDLLVSGKMGDTNINYFFFFWHKPFRKHKRKDYLKWEFMHLINLTFEKNVVDKT